MRFLSHLGRAGMAGMRFSYHRGAISEDAAGRARRAENDAKMEPKQSKNGAKIGSNMCRK